MPELPEVETIRQTLRQLVIGKTVESVTVHWPKIIQKPDDVEHFKQLMKNQTITEIRRKGKFLLFDLTDYVMVSHLRMEGKYGVHPKTEEHQPHTHVIFSFTDGSEMRYRDVRKFGTMHLFKKGEELLGKPLVQLAKDPLETDFAQEVFNEKVKKSSRVIKNILLDQTVIAGLGNIYVDETLFLAGIHPLTKGTELSEKKLEEILQAAIVTLQKAVAQGGTTIRSYVNSQGQIGMFQQELNVYGQTDKPCKKCGTPVEKIKVSGRGTHYCPNCQV
ncbi:DNA-(apurinic or apyrimidinic site) lyase [Gracilibacillus ureilyticus]|uniref:Formamidopyrimidine-DNA glycosylase n=1 Tax=Gracilibacillus ureilyticus TaxID=531814 RepID=A0A1H9UEJ7_9BACI|nr:DNA-formamidopyrimidine glycosylase [Gracilibacillus ureilyticus]SES07772.1 DNA-(apurinic or apyrimidinic site) lyase [Gracilibacillus ureilyticus]